MIFLVEMTLEERLNLITAYAPKLRVAGVQSLELEGIRMVLAPPDPPEAQPDEVTPEPDLAHDPDTYGSSGRVPGFERPDDLPRR